MSNINYKELIGAMEELEKERGINKEYLLESLELALITAYKKNYDTQENAKVTIDHVTGETHLYIVKTVVENVEDDDLEIELSEAKKVDKKIKVGEELKKEIILKDFGRIAAQTAKQVVVQKIREAERDMTFNEYTDKKGQILTGMIQKVDEGAIIIELEKLEGIMPTKEQIPTEKYKMNQMIKGYVVSVERGIKGHPQVIFSRAHADFVKKLFEFEIPEIYEGLIEIKSISREAGARTKIAVYSENPNIDPVGSCVGQKGIRIQNIINELNGEKIDVIEWDEDPATFISAALLPARVMAVDIRDEQFAQVIVPDDQLSLAIGKAGQNARLAARLTGWKIDIKSESKFREMLAEMQEDNIEDVEEVDTDVLEETIVEE